MDDALIVQGCVLNGSRCTLLLRLFMLFCKIASASFFGHFALQFLFSFFIRSRLNCG